MCRGQVEGKNSEEALSMLDQRSWWNRKLKMVNVVKQDQYKWFMIKALRVWGQAFIWMSLLGEPDSLKEPISERPTYRLLPDSLSISLQRLAEFIFGIHILTKASCIFPQNQASFFRSLFIGISCLWELAPVFHPQPWENCCLFTLNYSVQYNREH